MHRCRFVPLALMMCAFFSSGLQAQTKTNTSLLLRASSETAIKEKLRYRQLLVLAKAHQWPLTMRTKNGGRSILVGTDPQGYPLYTTTNDNIISAATIRTNLLWPGGNTGLNLSGSSPALKGKIAIWDGGKVRGTHVELSGRVIQKDNATQLDDHATHTSGTLIAAGVNPVARGMSFGAQQLLAYDFNNDGSEMLGASPGLLISNHSYGSIAGWNLNTNVTPNRWEFYGNSGDTVDYKFGYYDQTSQLWDSIAYNAPFYLIVKSAGNNRGETGPAVGQPYYRFNASGIMTSAGNRPAGISSNDAYDVLPTYSVAKNILTVGAVNPIPGGYLQPSDVVVTDFTSWGPTDDGRIKPDVVSDGLNVLSCYGSSDSAYATLSGTSMSSPAAAGSAFLLQEYYSKLHAGAFLRSATLKAIIIHTADQAGQSPGPNYQSGWGLMNMQKAASVITSANSDQLIQENNLVSGSSYTLTLTASGKGPLIATICWTDPKAEVDTKNLLNNPARKLVNDLDLRISDGTTTYLPWTLDRTHPVADAVRGDDSVNNVEKLVIDNPVPGQTYTLKITHKGVLQRGQQAYSLIVSGVGGQPYCSSGPASSAGSRIDSVHFSNINFINPPGCTTYTNNTSLTAQLHRGQLLPIHISLGSCDASVASKIVKVYIDYNNNGVFDSTELVAQSGVINGNGSFDATITTPLTLVTGNYTLLRIVAVETANATDVQPCGTYGKGETQDYRIHVINPTSDVGVTQTIAPIGTACAEDSQLVTVLITNFGSTAQAQIPVSTTITSGGSTVASLNFTYPDTIAAFSSVTYTYQVPFQAVPFNTYTLTSRTSLAGDQDTTNDQNTATFIPTSGSATPSGLAESCGDNQVFLKSNADSTNLAFWYSSPTATVPIAVGNDTSTTVIPSNKTYYLGLNEKTVHVGPASKLAFPSGGYNNFSGNFVAFSNKVPLTIESARLYIGSAGTINFTVADTSNYNATTGAFNYLPISSTTINVYPTTPNTPALGTNINSTADTGAIFYLNLPVPETGNHVIIIDCQNGASIFRNNQISSNPYPQVSTGGIFSINGNSAISATNPILYQQYYYFFYNMKLQLANCPSTQRVPVVAAAQTPPVISLSGSILSSTQAINYQWYLNGQPIPGATKQTDTAIASGVYTVVEANSLGCTQTSNQITYLSSGFGDISMKVYPNPNNGQFTLQFQNTSPADLNIVLTNTLGQVVYESGTTPGFSGIFNQTIHVNYLNAGVYFVKVLLDKKPYVQKVVVAR